MIIFNLKLSEGFTLIELMVAISITAVLGSFGIAAFVNYNQSQVLQASANEVVTMLNLAKSRAQSQIKPSTICPISSSFFLKGYTVKLTLPKNYQLYLNCSDTNDYPIGQLKTLPSNITFDASTSPTSYLFPVSVSGAAVSGQIILKDNNNNRKTITVSNFGVVSLQ